MINIGVIGLGMMGQMHLAAWAKVRGVRLGMVADTDPRPKGGAGDFVTIPAGLPTLPELFGRAGYETFFTGKWHNDRASFLRSFERAEAIFHGGMCEHLKVPVRSRAAFAADEAPRIGEQFSTEIFCDAARQYLRARTRDRPFFAWLALTSPHDPRTPPPAYRARYQAEKIPLPEAFRSVPAFDTGELDVRDEKLLPKPLSTDALREDLANYYGMITHHDEQLGGVVRELEATGELANTVIVYVGDHGLAMGNHGLLGKQNLYEHSTRVPLVMAGPGVPENVRCTELVHSLDVFATLLELAGIAAPEPGESRSLVPLLAGRSGGRNEIFCIYRDCQRMVKEVRWKLIVYRVGGVESVELFDCETDPHERQDRSAEPALAGEVRRLRERLHEWQSEVGDVWCPIDLSAQPCPARA